MKEITAAARARAAQLGVRKLEVCVDCVAYAPHRRIDVRDWDVDYCFFSMYKVCHTHRRNSLPTNTPQKTRTKQIYGPHIGALYARAACLQHSLASLAHHFLPVHRTAYKLEPGGPGYELVYACTAVPAYLRALSPAGALDDAWARIAAHEQALVQPLLAYLLRRAPRGVRVVGEETAGLHRAPTVSFVVVGDRPVRSRDVVRAFDEKNTVSVGSRTQLCVVICRRHADAA